MLVALLFVVTGSAASRCANSRLVESARRTCRHQTQVPFAHGVAGKPKESRPVIQMVPLALTPRLACFQEQARARSKQGRQARRFYPERQTWWAVMSLGMPEMSESHTKGFMTIPSSPWKGGLLTMTQNNYWQWLKRTCGGMKLHSTSVGGHHLHGELCSQCLTFHPKNQ